MLCFRNSYTTRIATQGISLECVLSTTVGPQITSLADGNILR